MMKIQTLLVLLGCVSAIFAAKFTEYGRIISPTQSVRETMVVVNNPNIRQAIMTSSDACLANTPYDPSNIMYHFNSSPKRQHGLFALRSHELNACFITDTWDSYDDLVLALHARRYNYVNMDPPTYYNTTTKWNFDYTGLKARSIPLADFCMGRAIFNVTPLRVNYPWQRPVGTWRSSASWFITFNRLFPVGGPFMTEYLCSSDFRLRRNTQTP